MISVIVPTLNEEEFIEKCLNSLLDQTLPKKEYEIIVSDSSSTDATVEIAKSLADKVVVCERVSAGFGRNYGARYAKGDKLVFIDADTIACGTFLEGANEGLEKSIACTGPIRALEKNSLLLRAFYRWWSLQSRISVLLRYPIFPGFNFAVRKEAFEITGGFKTHDMTTEDIELSLRLRRYGKISFSEKMLVFTSTRRLKEIGLPSYVANAITFVLFKRCRSWKEHRKDF